MGGVLSQVTIYEACKNSLTNIGGQFYSKYFFAFDIEMNWLHTSLENNTSKISNTHDFFALMLCLPHLVNLAHSVQS